MHVPAAHSPTSCRRAPPRHQTAPALLGSRKPSDAVLQRQQPVRCAAPGIWLLSRTAMRQITTTTPTGGQAMSIAR
jgi:hypothetical protein